MRYCNICETYEACHCPKMQAGCSVCIPRPSLPHGWLRVTDNRSGRQRYVAIPSASVEGKYHLVNRYGCDCLGWRYAGHCWHHTALVAALKGALPPVRVPLIGRLYA